MSFSFKERLFIVAELGNDQKTIETENINSKLSGSYIKTGFNYNLYNNLPGLNNEIYVGLRYSQSLFKNEFLKNSYFVIVIQIQLYLILFF